MRISKKKVVAIYDVLSNEEEIIERIIFEEKREARAKGIAEGIAEDELKKSVEVVSSLMNFLNCDFTKATTLLGIGEEEAEAIKERLNQKD